MVSRKVLASLIVILQLAAVILLSFNNCAPIGTPLSQFSESLPSTSGKGLAAEYFANTVTPLFQSNCVTCHTSGGVGPATIYNYGSMLSLAMNGTTSVNNQLMNKMKNMVTHTGGNVCSGDVNGNVSPCREVKRWVVMEDPMKSTGPTGMILNVNSSGLVKGWAMNPQNTAALLQVSLLVGGPSGAGGVSAGTTTANLTGAGQQNGHYFNFQLPEEFVNAHENEIYAYADTVTTDNLLANSPFSYFAFGPSQAGRNMFTSTYQAQLASCSACHGSVATPAATYDGFFPLLANPVPNVQGSATNNRLINYASGAGGSHPGGNLCPGGKNTGPCSTIQQWWNFEFGP